MPFLLRLLNRIRQTAARGSADRTISPAVYRLANKGPAGVSDRVAGTHLSNHSCGGIRFVNELLRLEVGCIASGTIDIPQQSFRATPAPVKEGTQKEGAQMENRKFGIAAMALAFAVSAGSPAAFAQSSTPTREGNIWDWQDHQPTQARTVQNEKAAGVAPSQSQIEANAAAEQQLYRQLMHRSPN